MTPVVRIPQCVLSQTRSAYSLVGEEKSTLVIRDSNTPLSKAFVIRGRESLRKLYYGILTILRANRMQMMDKDGVKFGPIFRILDLLSREDVREMNKLNFVGSGEQLRVPNIRFLPVMMSDDHPRVGLFLYNMADVYVTAVYLFIDQLVKLVKWMNDSQGIGVAKLNSRDIVTCNDEFLVDMNDIIVKMEKLSL